MSVGRVQANRENCSGAQIADPKQAAIGGALLGVVAKYTLPLTSFEKYELTQDVFQKAVKDKKNLENFVVKNSRCGIYFAAMGALVAATAVWLFNFLIHSNKIDESKK